MTEARCKKCGLVKDESRFRSRLGTNETTCKDCTNARKRERYATDAKKRRSVKAASFKARYNITLEQRDQIFSSQGNACAVCGRTEPSGQRGWHIDHDHSCCPSGYTCGRCIMGVLCHACNVGMGNLGDDPERLRSAITYLESYARSAK